MRRGLKTTTRCNGFLVVLRQRSARHRTTPQNAKFSSFCYFIMKWVHFIKTHVYKKLDKDYVSFDEHIDKYYEHYKTKDANYKRGNIGQSTIERLRGLDE